MLLRLHVTVVCMLFLFQQIPLSSSFIIPSSTIGTNNANNGSRHLLIRLGSEDGNISNSKNSNSNSNNNSNTKAPNDPKQKVWNTSLFPAKDFKRVEVQSLSPSPQRPTSDILVKEISTQIAAALIGIFGGTSVAFFKLSIDAIRKFCYGGDLHFVSENGNSHVPYFIIPILGAVGVALLNLTGEFSPGLKGVVEEVDGDSLTYRDYKDIDNDDGDDGRSNINVLGNNDIRISRGPLRSLRKAVAAIITLGTGNSLGPEGPGVEIGVAISRFWMYVWDSLSSSIYKSPSTASSTDVTGETIVERITLNRLFLACGAAAGVSSGFNAPLSGVFFALEVVQASLPSLSIPSPPLGAEGIGTSSTNGQIELQQQSLSANSGSITAILISSVLAVLVSRVFLGDELALQVLKSDIQTPLSELPLYIILGVCCGLVSVAFSQAAKLSKAVFEGNAGPAFVQDSFGALPAPVLPIVGGLACGGVGYFYPQVLFFGYETLNGLLENDNLPTEVLLTLLIAKTFTTAVSAGSGLVGGVFAPSLFLGGMTGAAFHNIVCEVFQALSIDETITTSTGVLFDLAGVPIYSSVGAASVLAALFGAPLTASLLLFEITRNYDVLLPLLASAGEYNIDCCMVVLHSLTVLKTNLRFH